MVKSPAVSRSLISQLTNTVVHPLPSPLTPPSISLPASLRLLCLRVLHRYPLQQDPTGVPGMLPSQIRHPQYRPTSLRPISLLLSNLIHLPYNHGPTPHALPPQIPLHLLWLLCPFQTLPAGKAPSQMSLLPSQPLFPPLLLSLQAYPPSRPLVIAPRPKLLGVAISSA